MVFLDTETTGVHRERRAWEIAMIRREDDVEYTLTIYVSQDDLDLDHADPVGLAIGRFQQRHPGIAGNPRCGSDEILCSEAQAARIVAQWTARATIFGVVPHFDTECLAAMLHRHGHTPSWRYWLVDVSVVAHGYLLGRGMTPARTSEALSAQCGVEPPSGDHRHTALGDAAWARRWLDRMSPAGAAGPVEQATAA